MSQKQCLNKHHPNFWTTKVSIAWDFLYKKTFLRYEKKHFLEKYLLAEKKVWKIFVSREKMCDKNLGSKMRITQPLGANFLSRKKLPRRTIALHCIALHCNMYNFGDGDDDDGDDITTS